jgi:hypothetical protein
VYGASLACREVLPKKLQNIPKPWSGLRWSAATRSDPFGLIFRRKSSFGAPPHRAWGHLRQVGKNDLRVAIEQCQEPGVPRQSA